MPPPGLMSEDFASKTDKQAFTQKPDRERRYSEAPSYCMIRELEEGDVEAYVELRREASAVKYYLS